jgi:hypothetical protein
MTLKLPLEEPFHCPNCEVEALYVYRGIQFLVAFFSEGDHRIQHSRFGIAVKDFLHCLHWQDT